MSTLVITEKPSVARSIASALEVNEKHHGYLSSNCYTISWCIGHLVSSAEPEDYDEKYRTWRYEDLPILPDVWKYAVLTKTLKQFNVLKELMDPLLLLICLNTTKAY